MVGGLILLPDDGDMAEFAITEQDGPIVMPDELQTIALPTPSPRPSPTQVGLEGPASPDSGSVAADDGGRAGALSTGSDCQQVGWFVERVRHSATAPLLPADLASAMLAARRVRRAAGSTS